MPVFMHAQHFLLLTSCFAFVPPPVPRSLRHPSLLQPPRRPTLDFTARASVDDAGAANAAAIEAIANLDADAIFAKIDVDRNGLISKGELHTHLSAMAQFSPEAIDKIFGALDVDGSGQISREELRKGFARHFPKPPEPDSIYAEADAVFRIIDTDHSGSISNEELRAYLASVVGFAPSMVDSIFKRLDINKDGEVSQDELRKSFLRHGPFPKRLA